MTCLRVLSSMRHKNPSRLKRLKPRLPRRRFTTFSLVWSTKRSSWDANAGNDRVGIKDASTPWICGNQKGKIMYKFINWRFQKFGYLWAGFSRQHRFENTTIAIVCIDVDIDYAPRCTFFAEQIATVDSLQGGLGHTDGRCVNFGSAIVALRASFPHAKVWCTICPLNVVDQILHEGNFILWENKKKPFQMKFIRRIEWLEMFSSPVYRWFAIQM